MFKRIVQWFVTRRAGKILMENPTIQAVREVMLYQLFGDGIAQLTATIPEDTRKDVCRQNLQKTIEIVASDKPVLANRVWLGESVLRMAKLAVLHITPGPELDTTGLRGYKGVTGELRAYLDEIIAKEYEEDLFEFENTRTVRDILFVKYWRAQFDSSVANLIRINLGDYHEDVQKDWFKPFVQSMCAYFEDHHRQAIGLPSILGPTEVVVESAFMDLVVSGERWPNLKQHELKTGLKRGQVSV